jgi:hypothetical protein
VNVTAEIKYPTLISNPVMVWHRGWVLVHDLATRRCEWSAACPAALYPGKDPVPIVQEAGWAPGSVWTSAENLAPTRIPSPDRPACSSVAIPTELPGPHRTLILY